MIRLFLIFIFIPMNSFASPITLDKLFDVKFGKSLRVVSGGSGLVQVKNFTYIISDNSNSIYQMQNRDINTLKEIKIFSGELPADQIARKKVKPDFESAVMLTSQQLLIVPSGSGPQRQRGAVLRISDTGDVIGNPEIIDFSSLYKKLGKEIKNLNIEGATVLQDKLFLLHRGNSLGGQNSVVQLKLSQLLDSKKGRRVSKKSFAKSFVVDLGKTGHVSYSFTDAAAHNQFIYFLASAEDTKDTYADGKVYGSIMGKMEPNTGKIQWIKTFNTNVKLEGLSLNSSPDQSVQALIISDLDNDRVAAEIYLSNQIQ